jgi:hypothetical protein
MCPRFHQFASPRSPGIGSGGISGFTIVVLGASVPRAWLLSLIGQEALLKPLRHHRPPPFSSESSGDRSPFLHDICSINASFIHDLQSLLGSIWIVSVFEAPFF